MNSTVYGKTKMSLWGIGLRFVLISILLTVVFISLNYFLFSDLIF